MTRGPNLDNWLRLQTEAERPFTWFDGLVPPADMDIDAACAAKVTAPGGPREEGAFDDFGVKARNLARLFDGERRVLLDNACLIVLLRRREPPEHVRELFVRLWTSAHGVLAAEHDLRWVISSAETLADFGASEVQRRACGQMAVLCKAIKLHETERLLSGHAPDALFTGQRAQVDRIALDQKPFAIAGGDLDRVLITRLWHLASRDPVSAAVAERLIPSLLADDRAIFRRLRKLRDLWRARRAAREG